MGVETVGEAAVAEVTEAPPANAATVLLVISQSRVLRGFVQLYADV